MYFFIIFALIKLNKIFLMFRISDFAIIFCTSESTISRRIKKILPILKLADQKQRKHFYTLDEANFIIKSIGIPPNNEFNRQLSIKYKDLF